MAHLYIRDSLCNKISFGKRAFSSHLLLDIVLFGPTHIWFTVLALHVL